MKKWIECWITAWPVFASIFKLHMGFLLEHCLEKPSGTGFQISNSFSNKRKLNRNWYDSQYSLTLSVNIFCECDVCSTFTASAFHSLGHLRIFRIWINNSVNTDTVNIIHWIIINNFNNWFISNCPLFVLNSYAIFKHGPTFIRMSPITMMLSHTLFVRLAASVRWKRIRFYVLLISVLCSALNLTAPGLNSMSVRFVTAGSENIL